MKKYIIRPIAFTLTLTLLLNSAQSLCMRPNNKEKIQYMPIPTEDNSNMQISQTRWEKARFEKDKDAENAGNFAFIPEDTIYEILKYADTKSLLNLTHTCKYLNKIVDKITYNIDNKSFRINNKEMIEKSLKKELEDIKSRIYGYGSLLVKRKISGNKKYVERLYPHDFQYYLYKIIKNKLRDYKDAMDKEEPDKIWRLQIAIGTILYITAFILIAVEIIGGCYLVKYLFSLDIYDTIDFFMMFLPFVGSFFGILVSIILGCSMPPTIAGISYPLIRKWLKYIRDKKISRLYRESDLEEFIFGVKLTNKIRKILNTLQKLEKREKTEKKKKIYQNEVDTLAQLAPQLASKYEIDLQNFTKLFKTDLSFKKSNNLGKIVDIQEDIAKVSDKINKLESNIKKDKVLFLQKCRAKLLTTLKKEIALEKNKQNKGCIFKQISY